MTAGILIISLWVYFVGMVSTFCFWPVMSNVLSTPDSFQKIVAMALFWPVFAIRSMWRGFWQLWDE